MGENGLKKSLGTYPVWISRSSATRLFFNLRSEGGLLSDLRTIAGAPSSSRIADGVPYYSPSVHPGALLHPDPPRLDVSARSSAGRMSTSAIHAHDTGLWIGRFRFQIRINGRPRNPSNIEIQRSKCDNAQCVNQSYVVIAVQGRQSMTEGAHRRLIFF